QVREGRIVLIGHEADQGVTRNYQVVVPQVGAAQVEPRQLSQPPPWLAFSKPGELFFGALVLLGIERGQRGVKLVASDPIAVSLVKVGAEDDPSRSGDDQGRNYHLPQVREEEFLGILDEGLKFVGTLQVFARDLVVTMGRGHAVTSTLCVCDPRAQPTPE